MSAPDRIEVQCHQCDQWHEGGYSHDSRYSGEPVYEVVCTHDGLSDFYTLDALWRPLGTAEAAR